MGRKILEAALLLCASTFGLSCETTKGGGGQTIDTSSPVNQAWDAYNKKDYAGAIAQANECINESLGRAMGEQEKLDAAKTPQPPIGSATSKQKDEVFARAALNDVATCLYIKGRSLEAMGQKKEATEAYQQASRLTYARCWDPKGWFWSPAQGSLDRLRTLK